MASEPALLRAVRAFAAECKVEGLRLVVPDELWPDVREAVAEQCGRLATPQGFVIMTWHGVEITTAERLAKSIGYREPLCFVCGGAGVVTTIDRWYDCPECN